MHTKTSLIKVSLFLIAILANIHYLLFILNPMHAGNALFYLLNATSDSIVALLCLSTWCIALYFELCKSRYYRERAELRKHGSYLLRSHVAVLITVVNEDLALVKNTLRCALALQGEKTVYLLDDGRRAELRQLAQNLGVRYVTRQDNAFYKAGNMNNALQHHVTEPFFVVIDADFALDPMFLQRTLPLFADPGVGAVQTPQIYTNGETFFAKGSQHLQDIFYHYIQPGKHLINSAFCVGTNVIFRRSAVMAVGMFAKTNHSEDIFIAKRLMEKGYTVSFLDEPLATGLGPTTLISFCRQQYRWARGGFLMLFRYNTLFNRKLDIEQRLQLFLTNCFYLSGLALLIYLSSPLIAILFNVKPLSDTYMSEWLTVYIPFFGMNAVFGLCLIKKYRMQSLLLGIFCFIPYLAALRAELFSLRPYRWRVTNQNSTGIITVLLAPYIIYLALAIAIVIFLAGGILTYNPALTFYYIWLGLDALMMSVFIVAGYSSRSKNTLPISPTSATQTDQEHLSIPELLTQEEPTDKIPAIPSIHTSPIVPPLLRSTHLIDYLPIADSPTNPEMATLNGNRHGKQNERIFTK